MIQKLIAPALLTFFAFPLLAQQDSIPVGDTTQPFFAKTGKQVIGLAGIYSLKKNGAKTATGEIFLNNSRTAAMNNIPFDSWVLVTNVTTNQSVMLRINDRISKKQVQKGSIIYLSHETAVSIGIIKSNAGKVKIETIILIDSSSFDKNYPDTTLQSDSTALSSFRAKGRAVTGIASFYSFKFDGRKTATGEVFRNSQLSAASNHFALNTWVCVTNLSNDRTVILRINDRMHPRMKKKGRVVDLSREAAHILDFISKGLVKVKVQPGVLIPSEEKIQLDSLVLQTDTVSTTDSVQADQKTVAAKTGVASFYGLKFDGRKTATGEVFRNSRLSAASNDFVLNTWVRVTNLSNDRSVILRINDRMHPRMQKKGRVIDLSRLAAQKLGFFKKGLTKVSVEVVSKGTLE